MALVRPIALGGGIDEAVAGLPPEESPVTRPAPQPAPPQDRPRLFAVSGVMTTSPDFGTGFATTADFEPASGNVLTVQVW